MNGSMPFRDKKPFALSHSPFLTGINWRRKSFADSDPKNSSRRKRKGGDGHLRENLFFHRDEQGNHPWKDTCLCAGSTENDPALLESF